MDFSFSSDQEELRSLANRILTDRCTHEHLKEVAAATADRFDLELWRELADPGLVGIGLPESVGGGGTRLRSRSPSCSRRSAAPSRRSRPCR